MKFRNKKTGEIAEWDFGNWYQHILNPDNRESYECTLSEFIDRTAEFREEWGDYEEPEGWWFIDRAYEPHATNSTQRNLEADREIGNYFSSKEEAELAVRKLEAWKRLKDKGFKFELWDYDGGNYQERIKTGRILFRITDDERLDEDLDLLFGGEE